MILNLELFVFELEEMVEDSDGQSTKGKKLVSKAMFITVVPSKPFIIYILSHRKESERLYQLMDIIN